MRGSFESFDPVKEREREGWKEKERKWEWDTAAWERHEPQPLHSVEMDVGLRTVRLGPGFKIASASGLL